MMKIRPIQKEDNASLEHLIKAIFPEFNLPLVGTAYEDGDTSNMYDAYSALDARYFVLVNNSNEVMGGGGIQRLKGVSANVCELQKMYFAPEVRGLGYGKKLLSHCLLEAKNLGYDSCYLESASELKAAIQLYQKFGFAPLDKPLGNTGHYSCGVWMIKEL